MLIFLRLSQHETSLGAMLLGTFRRRIMQLCARCILRGGKQTLSQGIAHPQMHELLRLQSPAAVPVRQAALPGGPEGVLRCIDAHLQSPLQFPGGKPRSLEDLKARYYAVARQLLVGREGAEECVANHVLIKHPFNPVHERWGQTVDTQLAATREAHRRLLGQECWSID